MSRDIDVVLRYGKQACTIEQEWVQTKIEKKHITSTQELEKIYSYTYNKELKRLLGESLFDQKIEIKGLELFGFHKNFYETVSSNSTTLKSILSSCEVFAHRGGVSYFIENTMAAFKNALELQVDAIELDVHLTKDNKVVVHHNPSLNYEYTKKSDGEWLAQEEKITIAQSTLKELRNFFIGEANPTSNYLKKYPQVSSVPNQSLPTLSDVIDLLATTNSNTKLLIEIKSDIFE